MPSSFFPNLFKCQEENDITKLPQSQPIVKKEEEKNKGGFWMKEAWRSSKSLFPKENGAMMPLHPFLG